MCDRFAASSWAYNVRGQECAACEGVFAPLHQSVVGQYEPDAYIWLDIPPEAAHERRRAAGAQNHFDTQDAAFQQRVYEAYTEYFTQHFSGKLVRVDATQPLAIVVREVAERISRDWGQRKNGLYVVC